jgi:heme oxygenase
LSRSLALHDSQLSFYDFSRLGDPAALRAGFRGALDLAGAQVRDPQAAVDEGAVAFLLNIDLSWAVHRANSSSGAPVLESTSTADSAD